MSTLSIDDSDLEHISALTKKEIEFKSSEHKVGPHVVAINYNKDLEDDFKFAISRDMSCIIFSNKDQHIMLDDSKDEDVKQNSGYNTRSLH